MFLSSQASLWQDLKLKINNKPFIWNEWSSRGKMFINYIITWGYFGWFAAVVGKKKKSCLPDGYLKKYLALYWWIREFFSDLIIPDEDSQLPSIHKINGLCHSTHLELMFCYSVFVASKTGTPLLVFLALPSNYLYKKSSFWSAHTPQVLWVLLHWKKPP